MAVGGKFSEKALTGHLRRLASEVVEHDVDGNPVTREQKLAELVWKLALGGEHEERDEEGTLKRVFTKPVQWAQQFLWERIEGKAPVAASEQTGGVKAVDKVRALARERINSMATASIAGGPRPVPTPGPIAPPPYRPRAGSGPTPGTRSDAERSGTQRPNGA